MLVDNQIFIKKWTRRNKNWYTSKGYQFTYLSDEFEVKAEDLSKGCKDKVKIQCDYCYNIIEILWKDYYKYKDKNDKYACSHCRQRKTSEKNLGKRQNIIYNKLIDHCKSHNYTLLTSIKQIKTVHDSIEYICPKHGKKKTTIFCMIYAETICPQCKYDIQKENTKLDRNFLKNYFLEHNSLLLNPEEYISWNEKNLKAICPNCKDMFITSYNSFHKHNGQVCSKCSQKESKGERKIKNYLEKNKINFVQEKRFSDCKTKVPLPFDFYLPTLNYIIEYDGEGHYIPIRASKNCTPEENLIKIQQRDHIKDKYCFDHNISILRIPYWEFDKIETIIKEELNLHDDIV